MVARGNQMTLDQAIADAEKASKDDEYKQLAEWLKELKAIKECLKDKCLTCEHCEKCREEYK